MRHCGDFVLSYLPDDHVLRSELALWPDMTDKDDPLPVAVEIAKSHGFQPICAGHAQNGDIGIALIAGKNALAIRTGDWWQVWRPGGIRRILDSRITHVWRCS